MVDKVTVTVIADPQPFVQGMEQTVASASAGAASIDASMRGLVGSTTVAFGGAAAVMQDYNNQFPKTIEAATAAAAAIEKQNMALLQQAAAEQVAESAQRARIAAMVQASAAQQQETTATVQATVQAERYVKTSLAEIEALNAKNIARIEAEIAARAEAGATSAAAVASERDAAAKLSEAGATAVASASSRTYYEIGVLGSEAMSGNFARMQRSLAALGNSTGFLQTVATSLMSLSVITLAVAAGLGAIGIALYKGSSELSQYNAALEMTGGFAGQTAHGLDEVAQAVGSSTGKYGAAREAVVLLAASGKVAADNFAEIAAGVVAFAAITGKTAQQAASDFEKIATNPAKEIAELNNQYHFLTIAQYQQIDAEQRAGDVAKAATDSQKALADAAVERLANIEKALPPIVKYWHDVEAGAGAAWNAMLHIGDKTIDQQLTNLGQKITAIDEAMTLVERMTDKNNATYRGYAALRAQYEKEYLDILNKKGSTEEDIAAKEKARQAAENAAAIAAQHNIDNVVQHYAKQETALEKIAKVQKQIIDGVMAGGTLPDGIVAGDAPGQLAGPKWDEIVHNIMKAAGAYTGLAAEVRKYNEAVARNKELEDAASKIMDDVIGKADPISAAWQKQADTMDKLATADNKILDNDQKMIDNATTLTEKLAAEQKYREDLQAIKEREFATGEALVAQTMRHIAVLGDFNAILQKVQEGYAKEEFNESLTTEQRRIAVEVEKAETEALKLLQAQQGKGAVLSDEQKKQLEAEAAAHVKVMEAIDRHKKEMQDWQNIMSSGLDSVGKTIADFATGAIHNWHDFGQSLVSDAKQFIAQIIQEMLKLTVFNGIMNSIFHTNLPSTWGSGAGGAGGSFMGGGNLLSAGMSAVMGGGGAGGAAGGGQMYSGLFNMPNPSGLVTGAGNLWSQATGAYTYTSPIMTGPSASLAGEGATGAFAGSQAGAVGSYVPQYGGYGSAMGQTLGVAGAVYAGYNEYQAAGGGVAGVAGGLAYGVGTYFAGAAATTAMTAGLSAGLAAIPVVGWIALAAMFINAVSGGKLFGTAATKFVEGASTETIGPAGATIGTQATYKGQRALFGGSYYKTRNIPVDPAALQAAQDFYAALKKGSDAFATSLGADLTDIVGGTFTTKFDKNGKATGTSDTVLGVTYKDETAEQFGKRLQADSFLAVMDKMGVGASKFVSGLQKDADKLFDGVQDLASMVTQVSAGITAGFKFMGISGEQTIAVVSNWVISLQHAGETITQTYQRLAQAQQQYDQFVGQFKPAARYVDDFEAALSQINDSMKQNIDNANALAIAAGAQGASEQDLINIRVRAGQQEQQLVMQLEASAQQLAFSLGLTVQGSLSQITDEIARLEGIAGGGATAAVTDFGNAMTTTAQKANEAINLMLGDLSPYNDQKKLQIALSGLREGTVTADQVLQIGRNLYASSQAYNDLFSMVMGYAGQSNGVSVGGGGGGGSSSSAASGRALTVEEQNRLDLLKKEQAVLQAGASLSQFQTLARQIAEIAAANHVSYEDVVKSMGIDMKDLEAGLGIANDKDFAAYMEKLEKQTDSAGQNTKSIVSAIGALPTAIHDVFNNKQTLTGDSTQTLAAGPTKVGAPQYAPAGAGGNDTYLKTPRTGAMVVDLTPESVDLLATAIVSGQSKLADKLNRDQRRGGRSVSPRAGGVSLS